MTGTTPTPFTPKTLGEYRDSCAPIFGEDSPQVKFFDKKIAESPKGRDEQVIQDPQQMFLLIVSLS
jgi:hypothetical protein